MGTINSSLEKKPKINRKGNRNFLLVFNFVHGLGLNLIFTLIQPYLYSFTGSEKVVGFVSTLTQIAMYVPQIWAGKLSDKIGRKICINIGLGLMMIASLTLTVWAKLALTILALIVFYFGWGILDPALTSLTSESNNSTKSASTFGLMFFTYFLGSLTANSLINVLGDNYSYDFYFKLVFGIMIFQVIAQNLFIREPEKINKDGEMATPAQTHTLRASFKHVWDNKFLRGLALFLMFDGFVWGMSLSTYNAGLIANFGIGKADIALLSIMFNVGNFVFQIPAGHLVEKIGEKRGFLISVSMGFIMYPLIILAWFLRNGTFYMILLFISQVAFAASVTLYLPTQQSLLMGFSGERKAEIYGVINVIKGFGFIPTGIIGGFLMEEVHFLAPMIIVLCCIPLEMLLINRVFKFRQYNG